MKVLIAYASRHGATQGIAERIADTLRDAGIDADDRPVEAIDDVTDYDAFVIGSAAYMFHWMKEAAEFVRHHRKDLAGKPVWLFSSGPLGTEPVNEEGVDQKVAAVPKEMDELLAAAGAREHHVFFGAIEPGRKPIGLAERLMNMMPAARDALPTGDFRDWSEIEAWAREIVGELAGARSPVATSR